MMNIQIAIDGPAGAGKSTIAKEIAKKLDIIYLDTGALYRSIGVYLDRKNIDAKNVYDAISSVEVKYENGVQQVIIDSENMTDFIRTSEAGMLASNVSKVQEVRSFLLDTQRNLAKKHSVVMDGRDIGTVILPNATVKIFLTASAEKRATRRYEELKNDDSITFEKVLADVIKRDEQDQNREIAPLKPAKDAIIVDTSDKNLQESIEKALEIINCKIGE